jgi:toxin ParE1/3/4
MKVRFSPQATQNLEDIADYIRSRNPAAAQRVRTAILSALDILTGHPYAGRQQDHEGVRKLVVPSYPYLIYYTVASAEDEAIVVAIQHTARERDYSDR